MDRHFVKIAYLVLAVVLIRLLSSSAFTQSPGDTGPAASTLVADTLPISVQAASVQPTATEKATYTAGVDRIAVDKPTDLLAALLLGSLWKAHPAAAATIPARGYQASGSYYAPVTAEPAVAVVDRATAQ
jgi:hypothetical protein